MKKTSTSMCNIKINSLKIKARILELGLNQEYIAKKMGLNFSTLNLKLNNKRPISLSEVASLAILLDLKDVNDFIEYFGLGLLNLTDFREIAKNVEKEGA